MRASFLWLIFGIAVLFFAAVFYAIRRGRDVRALFKIPFAAVSFETREPEAVIANNDGENKS
jgi:hypothetical protein